MENKEFDLKGESLRVFKNPEKADHFLKTADNDLEDLSPADYLAIYPDRVEEVRILLHNIEFAAFA